MKLGILLFLLILIPIANADCTLTINLNKTTYVPNDELIVNATSSLDGTVIFTLIDPLGQTKGTASVPTNNKTAISIFVVKEAWAKGNWKIQAVLTQAVDVCSNEALFYADTYIVPMDISVDADYALENLTKKCYNFTREGILYVACFEGRVPVGFSMNPNLSISLFNYSSPLLVGTEKYYPESHIMGLLANISRLTHSIQGFESTITLMTQEANQCQAEKTNITNEYIKCKDGETERIINNFQKENTKLRNNITTTQINKDKFNYKDAGVGGLISIFFWTIILGISLYLYARYDSRRRPNER